MQAKLSHGAVQSALLSERWTSIVTSARRDSAAADAEVCAERHAESVRTATFGHEATAASHAGPRTFIEAGTSPL